MQPPGSSGKKNVTSVIISLCMTCPPFWSSMSQVLIAATRTPSRALVAMAVPAPSRSVACVSGQQQRARMRQVIRVFGLWRTRDVVGKPSGLVKNELSSLASLEKDLWDLSVCQLGPCPTLTNQGVDITDDVVDLTAVYFYQSASWEDYLQRNHPSA